MNKDKQIEFERNEMSEIIAKQSHYHDELWRASDFEWAAHCLQEAGYCKASDVAREIFEEIENIAILNGYISVKDFYTEHPLIAEIKKKYTEDGK